MNRNFKIEILSRIASVMCFLLLIISVPGLAQIPSVSVPSDDFIESWLTCGPFLINPEAGDQLGKKRYETDFLKGAGGENSTGISEGLSFSFEGKNYQWKRYNSPASYIDLKSFYGECPYSVVYAACEVESEKEQEVWLGAGSDDGIKVWLNGKLVWENQSNRFAFVDEDLFPVSVKKGKNLLLVKIVQSTGGWGFYTRFVDARLRLAELTSMSLPEIVVEESNNNSLKIVIGDRSIYSVQGHRFECEVVITDSYSNTILSEKANIGQVLECSLKDLKNGLFRVSADFHLGNKILPLQEVTYYHGEKNIRLLGYTAKGDKKHLTIKVLNDNFKEIENAIEELPGGEYVFLRPDIQHVRFQVLIDVPSLGRRWFLADNQGKGYDFSSGSPVQLNLPLEALKSLADNLQNSLKYERELPKWYRDNLKEKIAGTGLAGLENNAASVYSGLERLSTCKYRVSVKSDLNIWAASSMEKISQDEALPVDQLDAVHVALAKHEYEAVQLILRPRKKLKNLEIEAGPLTNQAGNVLDASNIAFNRVEYVEIEKPSNANVTVIDGKLVEVGEYAESFGTAGMWPDPLPPVREPFTATAGQNTPVWITVYAPAQQAGGIYKGQIAIKSNGKTISEIPLEVEVFDFALPRETHTATAFGININENYHGKLNRDQRMKVWDQYVRFCSSHRVSPYSPHQYSNFSYTLQGNPKEAVLDFAAFDSAMAVYLDQEKLTSFNLGGLPGQIDGHARYSDEYNRLFKSIYSQVQEHLREKGWLDKAYWYWTDEPAKEAYADVKKGAELLKWACPDIRRLLTLHLEHAPVNYFYNYVNLWVPVMHWYDEQKARARQKLGETAWWYVCCNPKGPYPGNFIDHPAINHRIRYWMMDKLGVQGDLYWRITYWDGHNPWKQTMSINDKGTGIWGNGDGILVYPPRREKSSVPILEGPVTSIRFECIRDGLEDMEYLHLLSQLSASGEKQGNIAKSVLNDAREELVQSMTCYEQSTLLLQAMRFRTASAIVKNTP